jgi:hypothetical protein
MKPLIVTCFVLVSLTGCAGNNWSRNIYEGIRQQQETTTDPRANQPIDPQPDYEKYRRERDALTSAWGSGLAL